MSESVWKIPYCRPDISDLIEAGVTPLLAAVLASRGITDPEKAYDLLHSGPESLIDPMRILGMEDARSRILRPDIRAVRS